MMTMRLRGKIIKGDGRGTGLGYPTANLDRRSSGRHPVPEGVWACRAKVGKHAPYRSEASGAGSENQKVRKISDQRLIHQFKNEVNVPSWVINNKINRLFNGFLICLSKITRRVI